MTKPAEGWKCPECGKVKAPWVSECNHALAPLPSPTTPYPGTTPLPPYYVPPWRYTHPSYRITCGGNTVKARSDSTLLFNSN